MSEPKHTPGPWKVKPLQTSLGMVSSYVMMIYGPDGEEIGQTKEYVDEVLKGCKVNGKSYKPKPTGIRPYVMQGEPIPIQPNARLIAAAPDMADRIAELEKTLIKIRNLCNCAVENYRIIAAIDGVAKAALERKEP